MARDAKGRFCKKEEEVKCKKNNKKSSKTRPGRGEDFIGSLDALKQKIDAGEIGCGVIGLKLDGSPIKPEDIMGCLDMVFSLEENLGDCEGKVVTAEEAPEGLVDVFKTLLDVKKKMEKQQAAKGTPIKWELAEPMWVDDLHAIYDEGCIPKTEEELRKDILAALGDAYALIGGYLAYLDNKKAACQCQGKCKGDKACRGK